MPAERRLETHHIQHPLPPGRPIPTSVRSTTTCPDHPSYRRSWTWVQGKEQRMGQGGEVRVDLFPGHAGLDDHVRVFDCGPVVLGSTWAFSSLSGEIQVRRSRKGVEKDQDRQDPARILIPHRADRFQVVQEIQIQIRAE